MRRQIGWATMLWGGVILVAAVTHNGRVDLATGVGAALFVLGGLCGAGVLVLGDRQFGRWLTWCAVFFAVAALAFAGVVNGVAAPTAAP